MTNDEFDEILKDVIKNIQDVLGAKGKEYASKRDRLHNFKVAARIQNCTSEKALLGMMTKHEVSVLDMIEKLEGKVVPDMRLINEKIGDWINYLILLKALFIERIMNYFPELAEETDEPNSR